MKRLFAILFTVTLVVVACGGDSDADDGSAVPGSSAVTEAESGTSQDSTETGADEAGGDVADLAITEVVFGDHVTITNLGDSTVSASEVWLCNRPSYIAIAVDLAPGESQVIDAADLGGLSVDGGEAALYSSGSFGDSEAIIDYVGWGQGGGRESVATDAGIWTEGDSVDAGDTGITAPAGGDFSADWASQ